MKNRNLPSRDDWATPKNLLNHLESEFGKMFDPCPINPKFDGLKIKWPKDKTIFVNPPYSRKLKEAFIEKAHEEWTNGCEVVMLLPVSTSTKVFHLYIYNIAEIRFLKGRVKFKGINTKGRKVDNKCGMHDSMIVIYHKQSEVTKGDSSQS